MMHRVLVGTTRLLPQISRQAQSRCPVRSLSSNSNGLSMAFDNDIAVITMDNKDNRINQDFFNIFHDYLDQIEGNQSVKGIITTGGGKFYSNGLDLDWMNKQSVGDMVKFMQSFQYFLKRLLIFPVPTVAALNGHTFAGGAVMAFAQDFRVMNSEKGWICLNEVHLDKTFFEFLSSLLRFKLGSGLNLNDALVYGKRYTADEALTNRLVHSKAVSSDLLEHSVSLLRSYIGKDGFGRTSLKNVKQHVYADCLSTFEKHINDTEFAQQFMTDSQLTDFKNKKL